MMEAPDIVASQKRSQSKDDSEQQQQQQQPEPSAARPAGPNYLTPDNSDITNKITTMTENAMKKSKAVTWGQDSDQHHRGTGNSKRREQMHSEESCKRQKIQHENNAYVILPWTKPYRIWWGVSVFWSILTIFFDPYQIAFAPAGMAPHNDFASVFDFTFMAIFTLDIIVNFNLAYYNEKDDLVSDRRLIARNYLRCMFWVDLIGVFPFYLIALAATGQMGQDTNLSRYLSLLRLFRLVRIHRVKQLFDNLQYNIHVSLTALTLIRNFGTAAVWSHFAACVMYFIARQYEYDDERTWIGGQVYEQTGYERYVTALYWSVVTFTTVGYGDFSPVNPVEQIFGIFYMSVNMVIAAWMIGSITLLIVKTDSQTSLYRDTLQTLDSYGKLHAFDRRFQKRLRSQAKLYFNNRQIADEEVLKNLPISVRRKVLRRLYLPSLLQTSLMKGIRQQFVDAFLTNCIVEIFSPGEEILQRGSLSSDLYLLVEGTVSVLDSMGLDDQHAVIGEDGNASSFLDNTSVGDSEGKPGGRPSKKLGPGHFVNAIGFFTETAQTDTVRTVTICKTLTLGQAAYRMIANDHPGSVGKILSNLLRKVEDQAEVVGQTDNMNLTTRLEVLQTGSVFDLDASRASLSLDHTEPSENGDPDASASLDIHQAVASIQARSAVASCKDVIKMHIDKMKDDHTTRFLFAASRDCTTTISLMCDQGFDPNCADYDKRTALMVAAMKGNTETVTKLFEYQASPNLVDMHGTSALYEAVKNGHRETMDVLMANGGELCMEEATAASVLCQTVFDGDTLLLKRLLKAKIQANAGDYDRRTAVHIAAAEGNVVALKVLVEGGADLSVRDRWNNTALDEATTNKAEQIVQYLKSIYGSTD